ncbi:phage tail tube protein [Actinomadura litoris]|uniref:Phage tail protein n=1 Tax=Actinomadura litoris TaxID=2678616 RepID=A0A7K1LAF4_9ACTN|nr:hypothetical protein [Actinomadura litoris]MUN41402.1 hypothetical protein [Actinomadura litoris]
MPAVAVPINAIALGPGFLYWAPLASAFPANTVAGGVFTDTWPVAWSLFGATDKGSEFNYELSTDNVEVAETLDAVAVVPTGRVISMTFDLAQIHATNFKLAVNGGTITTTGSGATQLNEFAPPELGSEVRRMIGWEAQDSTERLVGIQCFQTGKINISRAKGADKATLPNEWTFEKPADGSLPFKYWTTGAARA